MLYHIIGGITYVFMSHDALETPEVLYRCGDYDLIKISIQMVIDH
jgi:hypothetical protein